MPLTIENVFSILRPLEIDVGDPQCGTERRQALINYTCDKD